MKPLEKSGGFLCLENYFDSVYMNFDSVYMNFDGIYS